MDEDKKETKEEEKISYLKQVKAEREAMEKANLETQRLVNEIKEMKAEEVLSGQTDAPKSEEKKQETPKEYADKVMAGELNG